MRNKSYYKNLDIIRVVACIAVLLYHFGLLKGGYLAVCTFFVLSGYLSVVSLFRKDKVSLKEYYYNRLLKIYLPMFVVTLITVSVVSLFPNINYLNLKPEVTSILLGYNNYWQLGANADYFARHTDSPFIHMWYISILLQFDLIFPFIYKMLDGLRKQFNRVIPVFLTGILTIFFMGYFYIFSLNHGIMEIYYDTFARIFSLLFGVFIGIIHCYYGSFLLDFLKKKPFSKIMFYTFLGLLVILYFLVSADSSYFTLGMIAVTLISGLILDYAVLDSSYELSIFDKVIKSLASKSYYIYLLQYPVLFLFEKMELGNNLFIMIFLILVISYILSFALNIKNKEYKILRYFLYIVVMLITTYGGYLYYLAKDYTKEMKELKNQLAINAEYLLESKEKYLDALKEEEDNWNNILKDFASGEEQIKEVVSNLPILGLGDSVMLGAIDSLYKTFPNGYIDAKVSRTAWEVGNILDSLEKSSTLGNPVIINLGANGDCSNKYRTYLMNRFGNRKIFWINTTNDLKFNEKIKEFAKDYPNLYVIDWNSYSKDHPEYFVYDGIHLTGKGRREFAKLIYDNIYNVYLKEYRDKVNSALEEHENSLRKKISFLGNDLLLNAFSDIKEEFDDSNYIIDKDFTFNKLKVKLENDNSLTYRLVFLLDNSLNISKKEYLELFDLCKDKEVYILSINNNLKDLDLSNYPNIKVLSFYEEILLHKDYLLADGIHLSNSGNKALVNYLNESLK